MVKINFKEIKKRLSWSHIRTNFKTAFKPHLEYARTVAEHRKLKRETNNAN